jgi:hypothetical protein
MLDVRNPLAPIVVGSGLIITVNPGNLLLAGVPTNITSTVIALTQSATNFVHVTSGGVVAVSTSSFPVTALPIAQITCSQTSITNIIDSRPDFILPSSAGAAATLFSGWGGIVAAAGTVNALSLAGKIQTSGFYVPYSVTASSIVVAVGTADAGNNYDWGIYDSSGNLKTHVGARTVPGTGVVDVTVASFSLTAGKYYFAFTGAATTALLKAASGTAATTFATFSGTQEVVTTSSGGALPSTITVLADAWVNSSALHAFTLHS